MSKATVVAMVGLLHAPGLLVLAGIHWTWALAAGAGLLFGLVASLLDSARTRAVPMTSLFG